MTLPLPVRVASVPAGHPYVRAITPSSGDVVLLSDPIPTHRPPGQWWPPVVLTADWLLRERPDVLHVHFGYESLTLDELTEALDAADRVAIPLVVTVHDLANPQLAEQSHHRAQLALLLARAAVVITLTDGAAEQIRAEYGRRALVLPHPTLLEDPPPPATGFGQGIGLHLKSMRAGTDRAAIDDVLAAATELAVDCTLSVHPGHGRELRGACTRAARVRWWEHPPLSEPELMDWLTSLGVLVLPYAHGTHSGLIELCGDLGVPVAVPRVGQHRDQQPDPGLLGTWAPGDRAELTGTLASLLAGRGTVRPNDRSERIAQRDRVAARHAALWQGLRADRPTAAEARVGP